MFALLAVIAAAIGAILCFLVHAVDIRDLIGIGLIALAFIAAHLLVPGWAWPRAV
jgi:hypothetical protein